MLQYNNSYHFYICQLLVCMHGAYYNSALARGRNPCGSTATAGARTFVFYGRRSVHAVLLVATTVSLHGTLVNDASLTLQPALALAHAPLRCPQHYSLLIIKLFIIIIIISVFLRHNFKKPQSLSMSYFNDSYRQLQPKQSSLCQTAVCSPKEALQRFVDQ